MKKYWKTIVISFVVLLTVSLFYIYGEAAKNLPYKVETVRGDEKEIENSAFRMMYYNSRNAVNSEVRIGTNGTREMDDGFFLGVLSNETLQEPIKQYVKEYRSYMRGKELSAPLFYEEQERLIYANAVLVGENSMDQIFQVDILNKDTKERVTFAVQAPKMKDYVSVRDVYTQNGEIIVLTEVFGHDSGTELYLYVIDEKTKQLIAEQPLAKKALQEGAVSRYYLLNNTEMNRSERYYAYNTETIKMHDMNDGGYQEELISRAMYVYDMQTKRQKEIKVPAMLKDYLFHQSTFEKDVMIVVPAKEGVEVWRYNLQTETWRKLIRFDHVTIDKNNEGSFFYKIKSNKLYTMVPTMDGIKVFIHHFETGKLLYEGKIVGGDVTKLEAFFDVVN